MERGGMSPAGATLGAVQNQVEIAPLKGHDYEIRGPGPENPERRNKELAVVRDGDLFTSVSAGELECGVTLIPMRARLAPCALVCSS
jgi:hypothetical protein